MEEKQKNKLPGKLGAFFQSDKKVRILLILVAAGLLLIFLSECDFGKKEQQVATEAQLDQQTAIYTQKLEERITSMISSIEGVGTAEVMITLQNGVEYVYAQEEKVNKDSTRDYDDGNEKKVQQKGNTEKNYIIVEDEQGNKKALVQTTKEPTVQGVVVVCDGGGNLQVQEKVIESIATALHVDWSQVCVTKRSGQKA